MKCFSFLCLIQKWVIFTFLTLFWVSANANSQIYEIQNDQVYEIQSVIQHLSTHLNNNDAEEYAIIVYKYSIKYGIDWKIPVVIFKQESDFVLDRVNYKTNDIGLGQLNWHWHVKRKRLHLKKLLTDPDYAIHETYKILYKLKTKFDTNSVGWRSWFTRYNNYKPFYRKRYYRSLARWFRKTEQFLSVQRKAYPKARTQRAYGYVRGTVHEQDRNSRSERTIPYYHRQTFEGRRLGRREKVI